MYEDHFHFKQTPFSIAPDPEFLYLSDGHKEALAHLTYGFSHGGFVLVTGEVGTGKTTLLRNLVSQTPESLDVAFVLNPRLTVRELLETLCDELGIEYPPGTGQSVKQFIDALNRHLLETHRAGRGTVVIIDEAQNLSPAVLEQIRLLTNLETDKRKLLRIILIGQPELAELLARNELRQLAQRITARYHLGSLSREDSYAYIVHRLARAGGNPHLFTRPALYRLYAISKGTPRLINLVADRSLLGAYAEGRQRVTAGLVGRAAAEVLGRPRLRIAWIAAGAAAALAAGAVSAYFLLPAGDSQDAPALTAPAPARSEPARAEPADAPSEPAAPFGDDTAALAGPPEDPASALPAAARDDDAAGSDTPQWGDSEELALLPESVPAPDAADPVDAPRARSAAELERPEDLSPFQTQRLAYETVLSQWGADLREWPNARVPCNFAPSAGLQCLSTTGSWTDIRRLNLPVVLELWDKGAAPYYGAVTHMEDESVTLGLGHERFTVSLEDLQDIWFGSYVLLWKMPPNYSGSLKRGDRHPSVRWLREQLTSLGMAAPASGDAAVFDAALQDAVVDFQRRESLLADGIVGPATWIRLGARLDLPAPDLEG